MKRKRSYKRKNLEGIRFVQKKIAANEKLLKELAVEERRQAILGNFDNAHSVRSQINELRANIAAAEELLK